MERGPVGRLRRLTGPIYGGAVPESSAARGSTAAEFAEKRFGGPTRLRESTVSVGTAATRVLLNDPRRVFWHLMNRSVNDGAVGFSAGVTSGTGLLVGALGGEVSMDVSEDGEACTYEVFGINAVAAGDYNLLEVLRV